MSSCQKAKSKLLGYLICVAFLFSIVGCGGGAPPVPSPQKAKGPSIEKKKVQPPQALERKEAEKKEPEKKEGEKKEEAEYTYNSAGKPDPFKPFFQLTPAGESRKGVPLTPLQKYELSQLKIVAILTLPEGNVALVEDSAGKGYFLRKGTEIGKNNGKVTKILKDRVIVEEQFQDIFGQRKVNEVSLSLHRIEEGGGEQP